ncbi:MAG: radical SAM family heme chaperone HemW [Deltaproteobacteria bacterium]|nr:radical SAM family heme chaperone HemW [Deltaproteobacteria bacterium]
MSSIVSSRSRGQAGLYLHIPFCSAICPYCDFSVLLGGPKRRQSFIASLLTEMALQESDGWSFDTVYFGGGTPSALEPEDLVRILAAAGERFTIEPRARLFFEANPEDVTADSALAWKRAGVETLSLGIQSFNSTALQYLGRRHDPDQARKSVEIARQTGFSTVSLDLIYGWPGQVLEDWRRDLETAAATGVDHLSCYQLTIHQGTPFGFRAARGQLREMDQDSQADLFRLTHSLLRDKGLPGYEVSSFARDPTHQSKHNRKYWNHTPYLGLGPSAHSFVSSRRSWNVRKLGSYETKLAQRVLPEGGSEGLSPRDLALEALMLGFRTYEGIDFAAMEKEYEVSLLEGNEAVIERLLAEGLVSASKGRLKPTLAGLAVADSLALAFELPALPG